MPKIAQQTQPQVQTQVVRGARAGEAPLGAFAGASMGQGLQQVGQGLGELAQYNAKQNERVSQTRAEETLVQFEREKNDLFFNTESGYFNLQGRDAYDNADVTREKLNKLKEKYMGNLTDERAKQLFSKVADNHLTRALTDVDRHASKGFDAWETATANAVVENTIENASLYWNNEDDLNTQIALGVQQIIDTSTNQGLGSEAIAEKVQTFKSSFAVSAIDAALVDSSSSAEKLIKKYEKDLEGPDMVKVKKALATKKKAEKTATDSTAAFAYADAAIKKHIDDRQAIMDEINQIEDPEIRKIARTEAITQLEQNRKAEVEKSLQEYKDARSYITGQGTLSAYQTAFSQEWNNMTDAQRTSLEKLATGKVVNDAIAWVDVQAMRDEEVMKLTPGQVKNLSAKLTPSHFNTFTNRWNSLNNPNDTAAKVAHQTGRTRAQQTKSAIEQIMDKPSNKWTVDDKQRVNQFYWLVDSEYQQAKADLGRELTSQEYTGLINRLSRKVVIERSGWFDKEMILSDIPAEDLQTLISVLRENGATITSENLIKAYMQASE